MPKFVNFEIDRDYAGTVKDGGERPLVAIATLETQPEEPGWGKVKIRLDKSRLESLLDHFQYLAFDQLRDDSTRSDDQLIGGIDMLEPDPPEVAELKSRIAELERNSGSGQSG